METIKNRPTTPTRFVKLFIRNQRTMRQYFEARVVESVMVGDKLTKRIADKIETQDTTDLVLFMGRYGVAQSEITVAGQVMAMNDHNGADFGVFGGFITSFLDEVLQ